MSQFKQSPFAQSPVSSLSFRMAVTSDLLRFLLVVRIVPKRLASKTLGDVVVMANGEYNECKNKSCQFSIHFNQSKEVKCLHGCHWRERERKPILFFRWRNNVNDRMPYTYCAVCYTIKRLKQLVA